MRLSIARPFDLHEKTPIMSKLRREPSVRPESALPSGPDVADVLALDLPRSGFPGGKTQAFRVFIDSKVHADVLKHAKDDVSIEICGVLVGRLCRDDAGPFVEVTASIRGDAAQNRLAEVTFTHETWSRINAEMDGKYSDRSIMGWYHTHPDFGIFLSERDRFIQENFFSGPGQIAYVVDPVRNQEGVFAWEKGKPTPLPHYWVGDELRDAPENPSEQVAKAMAAVEAEPTPTQKTSGAGSAWSFWNLLLCVSTLLLGYLIGSLKMYWDDWERRQIVKGVVANYGIYKGLKPRFDIDTLELRILLQDASLRLDRAKANGLLDGTKKNAKASSDFETAQDVLSQSRARLERLAEKYTLSPEERSAVVDTIIEQLKGLDAERQSKLLEELDLKPRDLGLPSSSEGPKSSESSKKPPADKK